MPDLVEFAPAETWDDWLAALGAGTLPIVQVWTLDAVLKEMALGAVGWYVESESAPKRRMPRVTLSEMRHWINATENLAKRLPYSGPLPEQLRAAAAALERTVDWPRRYFVRFPPSVDTKADADFRVNLNLWAMDQLLRAMNDAEPEWARLRSPKPESYVHVRPTEFWPMVFRWLPLDVDPSFADYKEAQKRVARLQSNIKPGAADALMVDLLRQMARDGRVGPDGNPRKRPH